MLDPSPSSKNIPTWVWLSLIPTFGSLALVYAGHKSKTSEWMYLGIGVFVASLIVASSEFTIVLWLFQVAAAFYIKNAFLKKMLPASNTPGLHDLSAGQRLPTVTGKLDINNCSKDEMVRILGLPIVYANDIESLRNEGYIFTHLEEISEIAGLPESYLKQLEPMIMFTYDYRKEHDASWKRVNIYSIEGLVNLGLTLETAEKIVKERENAGEYRSVLDIKRRTGIPFKFYELLI